MEKDVPDFILNNDELYSEQVLLDYDGTPILFICKGKNSGKRYVSVCTDSNELKYIIVECETKTIIEMILGKIELSKCLRSNDFYYEVVAGSNCNLDKVEKKNIEELDKLNKDMPDKDFKFNYKFTYNAKKIEDYLDNLRYVKRGFVVFDVNFSKILELEDNVYVSVKLGFMNDDVAYISFDREKCDYILRKYEKPIISYIEEIIDIFNSIIIGSRKKVDTASFNRGEKKIFIYRDDRTFYIFDGSYYHIIMELFRNLSDVYHRYNADEAIDTIFNKKYKDLLNNLLNYIDEDKYLKIEGDVEYIFHKYSINRSLKTYDFDARHILGIKRMCNKNINARIAINTKFVDIDEFGIYIKSSDNPIYDRILNNRIIYNIFKTSIFNKDDIVKMSDNYWRVKSYISFDILTKLIHSSIYDVRGVDIWSGHKNGGIQLDTMKYFDFTKFVDEKIKEFKFAMAIYNFKNKTTNSIGFSGKDCGKIEKSGYDKKESIKRFLNYIDKEVLKDSYEEGKSIFVKETDYMYTYDSKYYDDVMKVINDFKNVKI